MANSSVWYQIGRIIRELIGASAKSRGQRGGSRPTLNPPTKAAPRQAPRDTFESPGQFGSDATRDLSPAEFTQVRLEYSPTIDDDPDPGEIVWTWVPYVENDGRGKDRPVLIIGRIDATTVVGCYISTKQHRGFISLGRGDWDPQRRESFLSPERLLRVTHTGMRREGAVVERSVFDAAVRGVMSYHRAA